LLPLSTSTVQSGCCGRARNSASACLLLLLLLLHSLLHNIFAFILLAFLVIAFVVVTPIATLCEPLRSTWRATRSTWRVDCLCVRLGLCLCSHLALLGPGGIEGRWVRILCDRRGDD
jgi:hypothetical protein